ncbi:MAG: hypothetical protein K0M70_11695 [Arenimonas sp.]|uniref:hypothetical protein n=1 Tax=Arenimonas sp. TaxID=1872635 RepID=UPI0025C5EA59|nr:hypothetical protein [Arenimonas sp.]MBW8368503.1 hypothetical protein [Arenimonas sp.]
MSLTRTVVHLLLALVLMAGGLAPVPVAAADADLSVAAMDAPCHGMADDAGDPPEDADCCQDGACSCDCLQHVPVGFLAAPPMPHMVLRGQSEQAPAPVFSAAGGAPEIRPPIP